MAATTQDTRSRGDATREALVSAATAVFSRDGFHAASTRAIAEAAGVQQALIGYHFQGKEGLYLAVFEHIAGQLRARLGPVADAIEEALERPTKPKSLRAHRLGLLLKMVDNAIALMVRDESAQWAQLIIREQAEPTQAFEVLYEGYMGRMLDLMTGLVRSVRGCSRQDARLSTLTIIGQMLVFRVARAGVSRQLGWSTIRPKELAIVQAHLRTTISAQLLSAPRKGPR